MEQVETKQNVATDYQQSLEALLDKQEVPRAISMLEDRSLIANTNLLEYDARSHKSMRRPSRAIYNKEGKFLRHKKLNRMAIPYQRFINEVALVFLYGRPVLWENASVNPNAEERKNLQQQLDDYANLKIGGVPVVDAEKLKARINQIDEETKAIDSKFHKLIDTLHEARFDSALRECKRYAGSEGCSAMLFHTYQQDGESKMLIRVLANSKEDKIYTLFDKYDRLIVFGWGYSTKDNENNTSNHYDIYTKDYLYECTQDKTGKWHAERKMNLVGKIPVIVFIQEVEWKGVESLIERLEDAFCKNADINDAFGAPSLVATGKVTNNLPQQEEESKFYELAEGGDIKYLEPTNPSESRKNEIAMLESQIMEKTFTPTITLEALRGLSNASGATLRTVMMLAIIKADRRKETHDGYLSRTGSLMKAIMGNVLDVRSGGYDDVVLRHRFQDPFGDDLSAKLSDLLKQFNAGVASRMTVLEQSYLIPNAEKEMERIRQEQQQAEELRQQVFENAVSAM